MKEIIKTILASIAVSMLSILVFMLAFSLMLFSLSANAGDGCYHTNSMKNYDLFFKPNRSAVAGEAWVAIRLSKHNAEFSIAHDSRTDKALAYVLNSQLQEVPERNCGEDFTLNKRKKLHLREGSFNKEYKIYKDQQLTKVREVVDPEFTQVIGYCSPNYCEVVDMEYNLLGYVNRKEVKIGIKFN